MEIHVFGYVRIRARWICPYAWQNVRHAFHGVFRCIIAIRSQP